ncbi:dihydrolipoyl dehydrogenase [Candidatus Magnetaquicoccus inordinatus]|uniref:dihydrolipoyl dehydrogenase n=1 Tax=Candidatus Magnetaquicoccus inordinatus TaxID=2496818 RepID=UPI00102C4768|nr:dihydrolipoyl dehydrogenase [Candidatus Magnetaquicoccus inordinatus]
MARAFAVADASAVGECDYLLKERLMDRSVQLVVLGAGPGGYAAAFLAASRGMQTLLIDTEAEPGGVCLQRGCIPSKALLQVARLLRECREAQQMGLTFAPPQIDLPRLRAWKEEVVTRLTHGLAEQCQRRGVEFLQGQGELCASNRLRVQKADGSVEWITFAHCILAAGSRPLALPGISTNIPGVWDSTQALQLEKIPATLLVVGGGNIGLELGSLYAALGSKVTIVEWSSGLLPGVDRDLLRPFAQRVPSLFASVLTNSKVLAVEPSSAGLQVTVQSGEATLQLATEQMLLATGRRANGDLLGLSSLGIELEQGRVVVSAERRTAIAHIFAIGDLIAGPMLAHKATYDARVAVAALFGEPPPRAEPVIPMVTYTDPEIAYAGLTEGLAKQRGLAVRAVRFPWAASGRAQTLQRTEGVSKMLIDPQSEQILGVGITGVHAGELIAQGVQAIEAGLTVRQFRHLVHPHPTLSESLLEVAEVALGESVHYFVPRRESRG